MSHEDYEAITTIAIIATLILAKCFDYTFLQGVLMCITLVTLFTYIRYIISEWR